MDVAERGGWPWIAARRLRRLSHDLTAELESAAAAVAVVAEWLKTADAAQAPEPPAEPPAFAAAEGPRHLVQERRAAQDLEVLEDEPRKRDAAASRVPVEGAGS